MIDFTEVYVGLGGNIGDSFSILMKALKIMQTHPKIKNLQVSPFYETTPVSPIKQNKFVNAVCKFKTDLNAASLLKLLQDIEVQLGKRPKPKYDPRLIDCDILFFGQQVISTPELQIPHPRWKERLFVLTPLADLTKEIDVPGLPLPINLEMELKSFQNFHHEKVLLLTKVKL